MIQFFVEPVQTVLLGVVGIVLIAVALILVAILVVWVIEAIRFTLYKCGWAKEPYWHEQKRWLEQQKLKT